MRVKAVGERSAPWLLRPFFWNQKRKYGQVLKPALLWVVITSTVSVPEPVVTVTWSVSTA